MFLQLIGDNAKSTIAELTQGAMGNYGQRLNSSVIQSMDPDRASVAAIHKKRMIVIEEPDKRKDVNGNALKEINSGTKYLSSRRLYSNDSVVRLECSTFLLANDMPNMNPLDPALERRIRIFHLPSRFVEDPSDVDETKHHYLIDPIIADEHFCDNYGMQWLHLLQRHLINIYDNGICKLVLPDKMKTVVKNYVKEQSEFLNVIEKQFELVDDETAVVKMKAILDHVGEDDIWKHATHKVRRRGLRRFVLNGINTTMELKSRFHERKTVNKVSYRQCLTRMKIKPIVNTDDAQETEPNKNDAEKSPPSDSNSNDRSVKQNIFEEFCNGNEQRSDAVKSNSNANVLSSQRISIQKDKNNDKAGISQESNESGLSGYRHGISQDKGGSNVSSLDGHGHEVFGGKFELDKIRSNALGNVLSNRNSKSHGLRSQSNDYNINKQNRNDEIHPRANKSHMNRNAHALSGSNRGLAASNESQSNSRKHQLSADKDTSNALGDIHVNTHDIRGDKHALHADKVESSQFDFSALSGNTASKSRAHGSKDLSNTSRVNNCNLANNVSRGSSVAMEVDLIDGDKLSQSLIISDEIDQVNECELRLTPDRKRRRLT